MAEAVAVSVAKAFYWVAAKASAKVWVARAVSQAAYHVSQIAITAAISYGISAATRPRGGASLGGELDLQVDADFPRQLVVGTRAVAGSLVAHFSAGTNNNNLHLVYALADHPCVGLQRVWADGRIVRDTPLTHGVRTEITAYSYSGGPRVWFTWWDGRPGQAADSNLISVSGGEWTSSHKGAGVAYVHVELQIDSDILTSVPRFLWEIKGAKLYNRRKDSTSGGSGAHRLSDPATWEYSENVMDAAQHYLLGYKVENEDVAFGVGLSPDEIPYGDYAAAADLCDEDVETGTGGAVATIKRYAANGVIGADQFFEDVLAGLQTQMGGRLVDLGGRIAMIGAEARTPVVDLTDADWDEEDPVTFEDRRRYAELYGAVEGRYVEPANLYQPAEIDRQEVAGLALPDGGEAQTQTLELSFETHPRRAARLARMWLEREQRQGRLSGRFGPKAFELEPGDWFTYSSDIEQLDEELFEVIDIVKHEDFTVTLTAQAVDPDIVAFANDNDPDLSVPGWIDPANLLLAAPAFTVEAVSLVVPDQVKLPAIQFTLTSTDRAARELVIEWRRWIDGALQNASYFDAAHADQTVMILRKGLLPSTDYKVRAKFRSGRKESPWSDWSSVVTTTADYMVPLAGSTPWSGVTGKPDIIAGIETSVDQILELVLSTQTRLDETRANLGKLGRIDGVPAATRISRVETQAATATQAVAAQVDVVSAQVAAANAAIVSEASTRASADAAEATARELVTARVGTAEADIVTERSARTSAVDALSSSVQGVSARVTGLETGQSGQAGALQILAARVTDAEGVITSNAYAITQVQVRLTTAEGALAGQASSIDGVNARLTSAEGRITAQTTRIQSVEASVGGVSAEVSAVSSAQASTDGRVSAFYGLKGIAGTSRFEFVGMAPGGGAPSTIELSADQIRMRGEVVIEGTLTTTQMADRAVNETTVSEVASVNNLNATAAYQLQDAVVIIKQTAASIVRAKAQLQVVLGSGSPVQVDVILKRDGVQQGFRHGWYVPGFGTYAAEWVVYGASAGASTWSVEVRAHRSSVGAANVRVDASIFDVSEVKK